MCRSQGSSAEIEFGVEVWLGYGMLKKLGPLGELVNE